MLVNMILVHVMEWPLERPCEATVIASSNWSATAMMRIKRLMRSQGSGHGRKPANQEQNATGRPRQPTMLP
jgi:hypothetical protein